MFRIIHPEYLILLLLIPLLWWMARRVRVLGRGRKTTALMLRTVVLICFILALAEVEKVDESESLAVFFVIDRSASIPADEQQFSLAYVQNHLSAIPQNDRGGIIFFGKDAAIQEIPREDVKLSEYQTLVDSEGTNIESAIGLAMAAFPEGVLKRIVLITDGNETSGNSEIAMQRAIAGDIDVSIMPLQYAYTQDVLVEEVSIPSQIREEEPFNVRVLVSAQEAGPGTLRVMENGQVIVEQQVELKPGKNVYTFTRTIGETGVYNYEAVIEANLDRRPANNRAQNYAFVRGQPRVLLLEKEIDEGRYLAAALLSQGINVEMRSPSGLPNSLPELQAFDCLILSNIPSADLSQPQQTMIETAVRDMGMGLVMIGGSESFGAGGYGGTPIERALPVSMDIQQKRVIPSGALVLIMHSCEIAQGNYWAQEISMAALDVISQHDYVGFMRYGSTGESWLFPLEKAGNKRKQRNAIESLHYSDIGDMPSFDTTMTMSYEALKDVDANVKHMVILSDGDPAMASPSLVSDIIAANISISTVCIAPHSQRDAQVMQGLAQAGKGKFYLVQDFTQLPQIFIKEASVVRRNLILEEPFNPVITFFSEIIQGFNEGFPQLNGLVITTSKPEAETVLISHKEDPLLAQWRYGLGKAVAFTSSAKSNWANAWLSWDGYAKFWGQLVRWALPEDRDDQFIVETTVDGDRVLLKVDAVSDNGEFLNRLDFTSTYIDPEFNVKNFDLRQTGPGLYEGSFPVENSGNYILNMSFQGEEEGSLTTGVSVPYSPEHNSTRQNDVILNRLQQITGNPFLEVEDNVFSHDMGMVGRMNPLWPLLLALAIVLFFFDIAARRVFFELTQLQHALSRAWGWITYPFQRILVPEGPATEQMGQLMQAKTRAEQPVQTRGEAKESLMRRLDEVKELIAEDEPRQAQGQMLWHELKPEQEPQKFEDEPGDSYTAALFRAKDRAKQDLGRKK